jgi:hypothetical protein
MGCDVRPRGIADAGHMLGPAAARRSREGGSRDRGEWGIPILGGPCVVTRRDRRLPPRSGLCAPGARRDRLRPLAALRAHRGCPRARATRTAPHSPPSSCSVVPHRTRRSSRVDARVAGPAGRAGARAARSRRPRWRPRRRHAASPFVAALGWTDELERQGPEGYVIRPARLAGTGDRHRVAGRHGRALRRVPPAAARADGPAALPARHRAAPAARAPPAEPLGQPRRHHRARLRRRVAVGLGRAARPRRSAGRGLRARERVDRHQRHGRQQRQREPAVAHARVPREDRRAGATFRPYGSGSTSPPTSPRPG